jgi:hypothetical protein
MQIDESIPAQSPPSAEFFNDGGMLNVAVNDSDLLLKSVISNIGLVGCMLVFDTHH